MSHPLCGEFSFHSSTSRHNTKKQQHNLMCEMANVVEENERLFHSPTKLKLYHIVLRHNISRMKMPIRCRWARELRELVRARDHRRVLNWTQWHTMISIWIFHTITVVTWKWSCERVSEFWLFWSCLNFLHARSTHSGSLAWDDGVCARRHEMCQWALKVWFSTDKLKSEMEWIVSITFSYHLHSIKKCSQSSAKRNMRGLIMKLFT